MGRAVKIQNIVTRKQSSDDPTGKGTDSRKNAALGSAVERTRVRDGKQQPG